MLFFPYLEDMEEAVMFVVNTIAKSMQSIPTVQVCIKLYVHMLCKIKICQEFKLVDGPSIKDWFNIGN